ncbi:hypothetical protein A2U01_0104526, partial [Trifolium medium]|nr:hypothetical protein [Trifolium medium]
LPQKSGRQLVDHLSEQAREVAGEASMERTPRALAMWMAGPRLVHMIRRQDMIIISYPV